ncbi:MAG: MBL fold metallo-hydrolase [candidate division Zixibacteria bacterium]|nr:MBL fold metallo-hydrolase [candidate division Zixibacteria bacterium]
MITLAFHGAAGTVTGSKYLVRVNDRQVMVDCGMFQGRRSLRQKNWEPLPFDASDVDAIILTHAHIDHIGYSPKMAREGFNGPLYATPPTVDIARMSLIDAAHIQEEDAEYRNKKGITRHEKALPLFDRKDVEKLHGQFEAVRFDEWTTIGTEIKFRFGVIGHILGAAFVEMILNDGDHEVSILFSGDVGRYGNPLVHNPSPPPQTDYVVCESTYGGRIHEPEDPYFIFSEIINDVIARKSILLIPAFAIGRTQQIAYLIHDLIEKKRIPPIGIHIDSPMAIRSTDIYVKYPDYHKVDIECLSGKKCILNGQHVSLHRKRKSSKLLNRLTGPAIIMSASGMLTGGRIMHHLMMRLPKAENTIMLAGFMAEGTLGRKLADGADKIYIHKQPVEVRAKLVKLHGLSGHGDYQEILHWLEPFTESPKKVFVTHGEESQNIAMAGHLKKEKGWDCHIPSLHETVEL